MKRRELAIYVHIPFCKSKCAYCDFASYPNREDAWKDYTAAVLGEIESWRERIAEYHVISIFIGGGTPSLLPAGMIAEILECIGRCAQVDADAEITIEANPGTLDTTKLREYLRAGVNRISFGAQSMNDELLKSIGRIHTAKDVRIAVDQARAAGLHNVSLDLMFALPGQTPSAWMDTLAQAVTLAPDHISAYSLILEEGTPLAQRVEKGLESVPDEDLTLEMQRGAIAYLEAQGYMRYEISNFARPGCECRHNCVYWERGDYLGVGCAAHSLIDGMRFENPRGLDDYLRGERCINPVRIAREDAMEETIMLSTRMTKGLNLNAWRAEFHEDFLKSRDQSIKNLKSLGLLQAENSCLYLTQRGLEVQNAVVLALLDADA